MARSHRWRSALRRATLATALRHAALATAGAVLLLPSAAIANTAATANTRAAEPPTAECQFDSYPHGPMLKTVACTAQAGDFATFDGDNTLWRFDLTEALLPYLENHGILSMEGLNPALKLLAPKPDESLYGYYVRLCEQTNDNTCFAWIAQSFSGLSLATLKHHVDEMMAAQAPIPVTYYSDDTIVHGEVFPPMIYPAHRRLVNDLRGRGIHVYVITAAVEEIARMVLADPKYGFGFDPADIIGVTLLLKDPDGERYTTARQQIAAGHFLDDVYSKTEHMRKVLTPYIYEPTTWFIGKKSAIEHYIHPYRQPIIVAGDARTDWEMLFHADTTRGARIWVKRDQGRFEALAAEQRRRSELQREARIPVDADQRWVYVTPGQLEATSETMASS